MFGFVHVGQARNYGEALGSLDPYLFPQTDISALSLGNF